MKLFKRFLEFFATRFLEERVISISGDVYLRRFYLCGKMDEQLAELWNRGKKPRQRLGFLKTTYLHCFHRPDADRYLHNHPWDGRGVILTGGYIEQRYAGDPAKGADVVVHNVFSPGSRQHLGPRTFHRVHELLDDVCWTLFWVGEKTDSWGYWDHENSRFIPWRELHGADVNADPASY